MDRLEKAKNKIKEMEKECVKHSFCDENCRVFELCQQISGDPITLWDALEQIEKIADEVE